MILTRDFVMLNFPKTGTTFTRKVTGKMYDCMYSNYSLIKKIRFNYYFQKPYYKEHLVYPLQYDFSNKSPHGVYYQIPSYIDTNNTPVFSIIRNPYTRLLSVYKFGWLTQKVKNIPQDFTASYPNYPHLSLDEFIEFYELVFNTYRKKKYRVDLKKLNVGPQTIRFLDFFAKDPSHLFSKLSKDYLNSYQIMDDLAEIKFLRQENLKKDLRQLFTYYKFPSKCLSLIDLSENENVSSTVGKLNLLTERSLEYVNTKERLIFKFLATKGINYDSNNLNTPF